MSMLGAGLRGRAGRGAGGMGGARSGWALRAWVALAVPCSLGFMLGAADAAAPVSAAAGTQAPAAVPSAPNAAPASATAPAAGSSAAVATTAPVVSTATIARYELDDAVVGDWVDYQVGVPPAQGVESRVAYRIHYEVLVVRAQAVTLSRTTLTLEGRILAREVFGVARYPRVEPAAPRGEKSAPAVPPTSVLTCTVDGKELHCLTVTDTVRENGLERKLEWALSRGVPITGLVYEKVNGATSLQVRAFGRGGEAKPVEVPAAPVASAPVPPAARLANPSGTTPPAATIVIEPVLPKTPMPLEGEPDETP